MAKFLLGVIVGVVIAVFGGFIVVLAIGRLFETKQPTVSADSALVFALNGDIPESSPLDVGLPFLQSQGSPTIRDIWSSLRAAASDNRVKAVVIQPQGLTIGWGRLSELRQDLVDFKKSGKPVYALLQGPGSHEFYLASAADRIFLSPDDELDVKGFRLEEMFFKDSLAKLGITVEVDHIGKYKDAGDMFTRTDMTPETREVLNQVLDQVYNDFSSTTGAARHKSAEEMKSVLDMGPFTASQAKQLGLVDQLGYEDELYADLKKKTGLNNLNKTSIKNYFRAVPGSGDRIALLVGEGDIVRGDSEGGVGSQSLIASGAFSKTIRQVRNDRSIKGVILRVDSPGGDAVASDEILHELKLLSAAKPLVISMSDVAASGGYFMSMTGDPVISYPDTETGSIGVLYVKPDLQGLYSKLGIQEDKLMRGKNADIDSLDQPMSDTARQKLHEGIESIYRSFVTKVATARKKNYDQIEPLAQGRVWMGAQAKQNGLVDQLGGLDDAVALIRKRANLPATGDTNLVLYPPRRSLFEMLSNISMDSSAESFANAKLRQLFSGLPSPSFLKGGILSLMPVKLDVR